MIRPTRILGCTLLALVLVACGEDTPPDVSDASADVGVQDVEAPDTGYPDAEALDTAASDAWLDAGEPDVGFPDAGFLDAAAVDAGPPPDGGPPLPESVLFIGNSFTLGGPISGLVASMARYAGFDGFAPLTVEMRAVGGRTLEWHRADTAAEGAPARVMEGWDALVLQEYSTRPTDQIGPAEQFKIDATWFHDLARSVNPTCQVLLYETWARRFDHSIYPNTFTDPMQMQSELRFHYDDAAERYIPMNTASPHGAAVRVARAGDAWASQLSGGEPPRLHAGDSYHASAAGQYLIALVIYSTLFGRRADGMIPLGVDAATARTLQDTADGVTYTHGWGARRDPPASLAIDDPIRFDLGPTTVAGWPALVGSPTTAVDLPAASGAASTVYVTTFGFSGTQNEGRLDNTLGIPAEVSRDTLWVGSFDGHAAATNLEARIVIRGLPTGVYRVELFASRTGDDSGNGRLTRYAIGAETQDLEPSDNIDNIVTFENVPLDARGEIVVRVAVSPAGTARFAYAGVAWVTRTLED